MVKLRLCIGLLFFLGMSAYGGALEDRIVHLIGAHKYNKNRAILHAVFMDAHHFKTSQGWIDTYRVVRTLKRLGLIPLRYPSSQYQILQFSSSGTLRTLLPFVFEVLPEVGVFNYSILSVIKEHDGSAIAIAFQSSYVPDPAKIVRFFQVRGLNVVDIRREDKNWHYYLNPNSINILATRVAGRIELLGLKRAYWVEAHGSIQIVAKEGNHWFPAVYVYDENLRPIKTILSYKQHRTLSITLPKGHYYIKIADRFTKQNIRNGFIVSSQ